MAKLSLFVGGGGLIMVGREWLWVFLGGGNKNMSGRWYWLQIYAWSCMVTWFSNTSSICVFFSERNYKMTEISLKR